MRRSVVAGLGGVAAAFLASLCCIGPLLFVTLGIGAGLASTFEPLRPIFGVLMLVLLGAGFWAVYGRRAARVTQVAAAGTGESGCECNCASEEATSCSAPTRRGRDAAILWSATAIAVVLWTFPTWSLWLL
jgi:mercuric ion transport protein